MLIACLGIIGDPAMTVVRLLLITDVKDAGPNVGTTKKMSMTTVCNTTLVALSHN